MKKLLPIILTLLLAPRAAQAYQEFAIWQHIEGYIGRVECIKQDPWGMMWFGTTDGIYSYDGHQLLQRMNHKGEVYSMYVDSSTLYAGVDDALLIYNMQTGIRQTIPLPGAVRAIAPPFVGTSNGLYELIPNPQTQQLEVWVSQTNSHLPHSTIYSLAIVEQQLFVGTYDGLACIDTNNNRVRNIPLPNVRKKNTFVNALFYEAPTLYVGTEEQLLTLDLSNLNTTTLIDQQEPATLNNNSIKAICKTHKDFFVGTDNGLFVLRDNSPTYQRLFHDARNANSIPSNVIWAICQSNDGLIWIGTDAGVASFDPTNLFVPIYAITNLADGNTITQLITDSITGDCYLAGNNGLIRTDANLRMKAWYRLNDPNFPIPHNKINSIRIDQDNTIWACTDGGLLRFDRETSQFIPYNITSHSGRYNANWCYDVILDRQRRLWIATCQGGVLVVDKDKFISYNTNILADTVITTQNGLPNNYIERLGRTPNGHNIVAFCHNNNEAWAIDLGSFKLRPSSEKIVDIGAYSFSGIKDGVYWKKDKSTQPTETPTTISISDIRINSAPANDSIDARFISSIVMNYGQTLDISLSSFLYAHTHAHTKNYYRFSSDAEWRECSNTLTFNTLHDGHYLLELTTTPLEPNITRLEITVRPPWYRSPWAIALWTLLIIAIIIIVVRFLRLHRRITAQKKEKEEILHQLKLKTEFYADVARRLREPLGRLTIFFENLPKDSADSILRDAAARGSADIRSLDETISRAFELDSNDKDVEPLIRPDFEEKMSAEFGQQPADSLDDDELDPIAPLASSDQDKLFRASLYTIIEANIGESDFNVARLASELSVSPKQLYRRVKATTGRTPIELINALRMKKAALMLRQGSFTIAEVMYSVGFSNASYFAKCFSTFYGKTPKQFITPPQS